MRIQHYEYDVDGETRRLLVLSETRDAFPASQTSEGWLERLGFTGVIATHERVQLGEYFEPDADAVDKLVQDVQSGIITADDIAAVDPDLKYGKPRPKVTREQAGKALHSAEPDHCIGWDSHFLSVREGYMTRAVKMLESLGIDVAKDGD